MSILFDMLRILFYFTQTIINKVMELENKKQKIAPILRRLEPGQSHQWPRRQYSSLKTTIQRLKIEYKKEYNFEILDETIKITCIN